MAVMQNRDRIAESRLLITVDDVDDVCGYLEYERGKPLVGRREGQKSTSHEREKLIRNDNR